MATFFRWKHILKRLWRGSALQTLRHTRQRSFPILEILEDRLVLSGGTSVSYTVTNNWGSGLQAQIQLTNNRNTALSNWQLQFNDPDTISSIWDAKIVSHIGKAYVIQGASYDDNIPAGGSVSFGFVANVASNSTGPSSFVLTGSNSSSGTSGGTGGSGGSGGSTPTSGGSSVSYKVTDNWGSGLQAQVQLTNNQSTALANWQLQFNDLDTISSIWDAKIVSHIGNAYVIQSASYDSSIPVGGTVTFGFIANVAPNSTGPSNFVLTGSSSGGSSGGTGSGSGSQTQNPTAANYTIGTRPGQRIEIDVLANDSDPRGYALAVTSFGQGKDGTVTRNADGSLTYTPVSGFTGTDAFKYTISDGAGGAATGTVRVSVASPTALPSQFFAPYVDMGLWPTYTLTNAMQKGGVKYFTLAFIVADTNNQPAWGGYSANEVNKGAFDTQIKQQIAQVRNAGGNVMVSFGGANGQELAQAITNVQTLTSAYQSVINAYNLNAIDFDIEGAAVGDHTSIDRRSQAIAALQKNAAAHGRTLQVWFTLPVLPSGLTSDGLYVVQSALKYGVQITGVNLMTMDYGESAAPNPQGKMGTYTIDAAKSVHGQLQALYGNAKTSAQLWNMIGLTPMIGLNDDTKEVFDLKAAHQVAAFAKQSGLGRLSMWSLNRDQEAPQGALSYVSPTSSSIVQTPYEFSSIFETFAG
jgi:hypothetical protein